MALSNCSNVSSLLSVELKNPLQIITTIGLTLLNAIVIFGNTLVILAVVNNSSLRNVTSFLITSLAFADLMIGIMVLPFSITYEQNWIFGGVWCHIWLLIDVWMCTASIYNLVVISVERYVAIIMPLRGLGFVFRNFMSTDGIQLAESICPMDNSPVYIGYSSTGSFFLPMLIITFVYVQIYRVARRIVREDGEAFTTTDTMMDDSSNDKPPPVIITPIIKHRNSHCCANDSYFLQNSMSHQNTSRSLRGSLSFQDKDDYYLGYNKRDKDKSELDDIDEIDTTAIKQLMTQEFKFTINPSPRPITNQQEQQLSSNETTWKPDSSSSSSYLAAIAGGPPENIHLLAIPLPTYDTYCNNSSISKEKKSAAEAESNRERSFSPLLVEDGCGSSAVVAADGVKAVKRNSVQFATGRANSVFTYTDNSSSSSSSSRRGRRSSRGGIGPQWSLMRKFISRHNKSRLTPRVSMGWKGTKLRKQQEKRSKSEDITSTPGKCNRGRQQVTERQRSPNGRKIRIIGGGSDRKQQRGSVVRTTKRRYRESSFGRGGSTTIGSSGGGSIIHKWSSRWAIRRGSGRRMTAELKAVKMVAIVTGCFLCSWLGFSLIYLFRAFPFCQHQPDCISPLVFSLFFWLGYANSAFNPILYALLNRKFRKAFRKLLICK